MLTPGPVVMVVAVPAAVWFWYRAGAAPPARRLVAALGLWFGIVTGLLMVAHIAAVAATAFGADFVYDFRWYALLLFGACGLLGSVACVAAARRMATSDPRARRRMIAAALALLVLNAPLVTLQTFSAWFTAGAAALLAVLALVRPA